MAGRFIPDRRGTVAVEFALVGFFVIELVLETLQSGLFLYQQAEVERAAAYAARQVMVGNASASGMTAGQFATSVVCNALPGSMPCANVVVDARTVSRDGATNGFYAYARADMAGPAAMPISSTFCTGSPGSVVYLRVAYAAPALSPVWQAWALLNGVTVGGAPAYRVTSYAAFRNEPFQGSAGPC